MKDRFRNRIWKLIKWVARSRAYAWVCITALVFAVFRSILAYSVLSAAINRVLIGIPWSITLFLSLGSAVLSITQIRVLKASRIIAMILNLVDVIVGAVTCWAACFLANFIASPFGSPDYLPLWHQLVAVAVFSAFSCFTSFIASIWVFAAMFVNSPLKKVSDSIELTSQQAQSAEVPLSESKQEKSSSKTHKKHCCKCYPTNLIETIVVISCIILGILGLALTIASASSLGLTFNGNTECKNDDCFSECEELNAGGCLLPFPSTQFLVKDNSTVTGLRVNLPRSVMPYMRIGGQIDPSYFNELDGFSVCAPALFDLPDAKTLRLDSSGSKTTLPSLADCNNITTANTAIIDANTGELVPHWAELDAASKTERPIVILQPAEPLKYGHRYIAVVRGMYDAETNSLAKGPEEFLKLMSWQTGNRWNYMRENILPVIHDALHWDFNEIQLTWDWTTASRNRTLGRLEAMRDDALERGSTYKVTDITENDCSVDGTLIGKTIVGSMKVSSYLDQVNTRGSLLEMRPGQEKLIQPTGEMSVDFLVQIPCSVIADDKPSFIVQYGHGFFGGCEEIQSSYLQVMSNKLHWILFSADWFGMSRYDELGLVKTVLSETGKVAEFAEGIHQGHVVFASLMRLIRTQFYKDSSVLSSDGQTSLMDPNRFAFYGISQGGILGGAYAALSTEIERVALGVPGGSLSILFSRSTFWNLFGLIFKLTFYSQRDTRLFLSLMQTSLDSIEAGGWAYSMTKEPGSGCKPKMVLIQSAINDNLVTNLATHFIARAYNATTIYPQTRMIPFIRERNGNFTNGNAIVEWDYLNAKEVPLNNSVPTFSDGPHMCPRKEPEAQEQLRIFLEEGVISQTFKNGTCTRPYLC